MFVHIKLHMFLVFPPALLSEGFIHKTNETQRSKKLIGFDLNLKYIKNGYVYNQYGIIKEVYKNSIAFKLHGMNNLITIELKTIDDHIKTKQNGK